MPEPTAIEFLIIAKRSEEAFELATAQGEMEAYTAALGKEGTPDEYKKVALFYEGKAEHQKAGDFWLVCKEYNKALKFFLMCGERAVDQVLIPPPLSSPPTLAHPSPLTPPSDPRPTCPHVPSTCVDPFLGVGVGPRRSTLWAARAPTCSRTHSSTF